MAKAILNFHFDYLTPSLRWWGGLGRFESVLDWSWVFWGNEGTFWGNLGWFWDILGGPWEIFSRVIEGRFGTIQVIRGHNRMLLACSRVFWGWFGGDLGDPVRWFEVVFGCSGCSGSGLLMQQYGAFLVQWKYNVKDTNLIKVVWSDVQHLEVSCDITHLE